jgi:hypothetical protein
MTSAAQLAAALKTAEVIDGATPGPWRSTLNYIDIPHSIEIGCNGYEGQDSAFWIARVMLEHVHGKANAAAILTARNDAPTQLRALVEMVEALTKEKEAQDRAIREAKNHIGYMMDFCGDYNLSADSQTFLKKALANIEKELGGNG